MEKRKKIPVLFVIVATSAIVTLAPSIAAADDFPCPPNSTGAIPGNVVVPPGAVCFLIGATVHGNVIVQQGAGLVALSSTVRGNVDGVRPQFVQVNNSVVWGTIHIIEATGGTGIFAGAFSAVVFATILADGNIQIEKSRDWGVLDNALAKGNIKIELNDAPRFAHADRNRVGGNLQVFTNRGAAPKSVVDNFVFENLQCFENTPPFVGTPNTARQAQGQCMAAPLPMAATPFGTQQ